MAAVGGEPKTPSAQLASANPDGILATAPKRLSVCSPLTVQLLISGATPKIRLEAGQCRSHRSAGLCEVWMDTTADGRQHGGASHAHLCVVGDEDRSSKHISP